MLTRLAEKELLELRTNAADAKLRFNEAMKLRVESQREVNDLLQRKSHWNSQDVLRYVTTSGSSVESITADRV